MYLFPRIICGLIMCFIVFVLLFQSNVQWCPLCANVLHIFVVPNFHLQKSSLYRYVLFSIKKICMQIHLFLIYFNCATCYSSAIIMNCKIISIIKYMESINIVCKIYTGSVYIETNKYYVTVDMNKRYLYFLICKNSQAIHILLLLCKYVLICE